MSKPNSALRWHSIQLGARIAIATVIGTIGHAVFFSDVNTYFKRAHEVSFHFLPYKDFLWEYPPLASFPLALIPLSGRNGGVFLALFVACTIAIEYGCMLLLRRAQPEHKDQITKFWWLSVVPLSCIGWFRLDFFAVLAATFAVIALGTGRRYIVATIAGFGVKLWPLVFGIAMVLERRWKDAFLTGLGCVALLGAWYLYSPEGFRTFLDFRQGSDFQVESIPGSILLFFNADLHFRFGAVVVDDGGLEWVQVLLQALFVLTPLVAMAAAWKRKVNLVAMLGAIVCMMLLANRLLSPQFLVWLAPFMAWLWVSNQRVGKIYIAAAWLTVAIVQLYGFMLKDSEIVQLMLLARNGVLVWLLVELFRVAFKSKVSAFEDSRPETQGVQAVAEGPPQGR